MPPKDINMRVPEDNKKCVAFIGIKTVEDHVESVRYIGTAFFVLFASKVGGLSFPYLVTAKHVAVATIGKECFIRLNLKDGKSARIDIPHDHWIFHPHDVWPSDVAICPLNFTRQAFDEADFNVIPLDAFVTDEMRIKDGIGEGDEIYTIGLFSRHAGNEKNVPIIRVGNIAMISDEFVATKHFGNIEAYLIESRSMGGLSGSPVFVLKPAKDGQFRASLLGLVHGHWDLEPGEIIDFDDGKEGPSVNLGIAIVVPAKRILETLHGEQLTKLRQAVEARVIARNSPTPG
jgi:hypothetical protein